MSRRQLFLVSVLAFATLAARADWPTFRGPTGDGHSTATGLPLRWSETENIKWKTEIPLRGWSTPVVLGNQVWLTTATIHNTGADASPVDFFVLCLDADTGKILFNEKLFHCDSPEPLGNTVNCYAACSAAVEPGRVYVHFGTYGTACLDTTTFKTLWQRTDINCRHYRGPSSSVILFENLAILTMDGADVQYLIALDKQTGKTVWKTNRSVKFDDTIGFPKFAKDGDLRKGHSTPTIATVAGKLQMFSPGAKAGYSYDPRTGKELWRIEYQTSWSSAPMTLAYRDLALIINGLGKTELYAVRADGTGDVTKTHVAWKLEKGIAKTASPVIVDDLFYMVRDDGVVTCLEAATGNQVWSQPVGGHFAASPVYADGRLYFCNEQGKTFVIKPGRTCELLATNQLAIGCMASPAVSGRALFLRTKTHLYRIESGASAK